MANKWQFYYRLEGHTPVPCTFEEFFRQPYQDADARRVAFDKVGDVEVSTVFLCIDHALWRDGGAPILFETMVFGGPLDGEQSRYETWDEAERGHAWTVARVRKARRKSTRGMRNL